MADDFVVTCDPATGQVSSATLYGVELLDAARPCGAELLVNGLPLPTRLHPARHCTNEHLEREARLKGERFVSHFAGWGLTIARRMGARTNLKHPCFGVQYHIRREPADAIDLPCPGPGGPAIEAPLHVDSFTLLNWNWRFWGDDTRMIFASAHSSGPADEFGHVGYENDTPERSKAFIQNVWRRIYPTGMALHGGVFYNARKGHWLAITCRRPTVGYILNLESAGRGVAYDFTLHAPFPLGENLPMPEIKLHWGDSAASMWSFMADYITFYTKQAPDWAFRTLWGEGLAWNNEPTWTAQADAWEKRLDAGEMTGISYCLVTNRPIKSGTSPLGYEPDPNHGTIEEFKAMCRRMANRGVPLLIWMSHSGIVYRGSPDYDDDWFIRGIDGRISAGWGNEDFPELAQVNPGHPGYIAYTKKWIHFYLKECGCKGIWFDCLGWALPPDFTPRDFMRFPGDTNRMAIRFADEIGAYIRELDPEAIFGGEGASLDMPIDHVAINVNPIRAVDGRGPREFFLEVQKHGQKALILDQGPRYSAAGGMAKSLPGEANLERNRTLAVLLRDMGGPRAFTALHGDLAIHEAQRLLVVPTAPEKRDSFAEIRLPAPWDAVTTLVDRTTGATLTATDGVFRDVGPGVYQMEP